MRCPKCGVDNDRVADSRTLPDGSGVRRRRECLNCGHRFSTLEAVIPEELRVIKRSGEREEYSRSKLRQGIASACYKRPVSAARIDEMVENVTRALLQNSEPEIESAAIGELVMRELKACDEVAYVRFASVYREFQTATDFISEAKGLKKK